MEGSTFYPKYTKDYIPGRPVISNFGTATEKVSEYLDFLLKPVMQDVWSYVKDTEDFPKKLKRLGKIPEGVVGLYPNIPHDLGFQSLWKRLNEMGICKVPTEEIIAMAKFLLKINYFEFNEKVCKQIPGTAIRTKFASPYVCIFMEEMEVSFLKMQQFQLFIWLRYVDDIFFTWTHDEEQLNLFLKDLNEFHPNFKFTYERSQNSVDFVDRNVSLKGGAIFTDLHIKPTDGHQSLHDKSSHPSHIKNSIQNDRMISMYIFLI